MLQDARTRKKILGQSRAWVVEVAAPRQRSPRPAGGLLCVRQHLQHSSGARAFESLLYFAERLSQPLPTHQPKPLRQLVNTAPTTSSSAGNARAMVKFLKTTPSANLPELLARWRARDPEQWAGNAELYRRLGERVLKLGEPLLAFDVVTEGLLDCQSDVRLRQLLGLALSRSGASERANNVLSKLRTEGNVDEETLGMLARTHKDLAARAGETAAQEMYLRRAAEIYEEAYKLTGGYWSGINAATMSLSIGDKARAKELAKKVREQCLSELRSAPADPYWLFATLGEAALILEDGTQAED